jgi:endogenous inhibitor of DNA gyrase (YacG/DUF329 family)
VGTKICVQCGTEFSIKSTQRMRRYCSDRCKQRAKLGRPH